MAVVLGLCAVLPWLVPALPAELAGALPASLIGAAPTPAIDPPDRLAEPVRADREARPLVIARLKAAGRPLEVRVPRLHVGSAVVPISGTTGELEPPADPQTLGWWQEGPNAGASSGSTVITGHTVHTGGGAFDHLGELVAGDQVRVRTAAGWIGYRVQETEVLATTELARRSSQIFRTSGPARLVLVTCAGWDGTRYTSNALVYAVPVTDDPVTVPSD